MIPQMPTIEEQSDIMKKEVAILKNKKTKLSDGKVSGYCITREEN